MEKNKFKKITAVVPNETDFVRAIQLEFRRPEYFCRFRDDDSIFLIRNHYAVKVRSAETRLSRMLTEVYNQFPKAHDLNRFYTLLLHKRYNIAHYAGALSCVSEAKEMIMFVSLDYVQQLMYKDGCDSRDKCKSLRVSALARMFTIAKRCVPILAFLDKVRESMAILDDDADPTTTYKYLAEFPMEYYPFLESITEDEIADFVEPETVLWLEELDRQYDLCLKGDVGQGAERPHMEASVHRILG